MAIELVGVCTYTHISQNESGGGRFYLTAQALKDLEWLQQRTEAAIDQALDAGPSVMDGGGDGDEK